MLRTWYSYKYSLYRNNRPAVLKLQSRVLWRTLNTVVLSNGVALARTRKGLNRLVRELEQLV